MLLIYLFLLLDTAPPNESILEVSLFYVTDNIESLCRLTMVKYFLQCFHLLLFLKLIWSLAPLKGLRNATCNSSKKTVGIAGREDRNNPAMTSQGGRSLCKELEGRDSSPAPVGRQ